VFGGADRGGEIGQGLLSHEIRDSPKSAGPLRLLFMQTVKMS
jgi:hypothetical protein